MNQSAPQAQPLTQWAIVDLFGRDRIAGELSHYVLGSEAMLRIDVPQVSYTDHGFVDGQAVTTTRTIPAHTRVYGQRAVYSIAFVDEAAAVLAAHEIRHEPVKPWTLRDALRALPIGDRRVLLEDVDHVHPAEIPF